MPRYSLIPAAAAATLLLAACQPQTASVPTLPVADEQSDEADYRPGGDPAIGTGGIDDQGFGDTAGES
ncbi:hypothetical protein [Limimaricola pyoseonensis]|uniref:Uncharacterized protein n=1 Tax=Limimaricola pyoseonensis TaxID=521013 RepID=A0A1G7FTW3_9RHOB|nr:hypothetical protein [Limimaricola pyoseonensis]SDE79212.1 hypothetical protein SAMN04488567_2565 [Limimaricola pyoseonensis]